MNFQEKIPHHICGLVDSITIFTQIKEHRKNMACSKIWSRFMFRQKTTVLFSRVGIAQSVKRSSMARESHQCLLVGMWKRIASSHAVCHEVSKCPMRDESQGMVPCALPPRINKAANSSFETQRRHYRKSKTGVSVAPLKGLISFNFFKIHLRIGQRTKCIPHCPCRLNLDIVMYQISQK